MLLIDWSVENSPKSDSKSVVVKLKGAISAHRAREIFEQKGFVLERDIDAGAHHYGMILVKTNE